MDMSHEFIDIHISFKYTLKKGEYILSKHMHSQLDCHTYILFWITFEISPFIIAYG